MTPKRQISSEERIFSLLLALAASRSGVTKHDLLSTVHGYAQRFDDGNQREALERQFERDKDSLRELGIPIETLDSPEAAGNNQLTRYRISLDKLELPDDIEFSARELSLLRLASFAWSDSTLALDSRRASMKLAALGVDIDAELLGYAPRISANDPAFAPLQAALTENVRVQFLYQKAGANHPELRDVAPLALEMVDGRWHLLSWDAQRQDDRIFLLSRITSSVKSTSEPFDPDLRSHVDAMLQSLVELGEKQRAVIDVQASTEAEARLRPLASIVEPGDAVTDQMRLTISYLDEAVFAEELVSFGAEVVVRQPLSLRKQVIDLLTQIRDAHSSRGSEHV